jgi:hypothetical protein
MIRSGSRPDSHDVDVDVDVKEGAIMPVSGCLDDYSSMTSCLYKKDPRRRAHECAERIVEMIIFVFFLCAFSLFVYFEAASMRKHFAVKARPVVVALRDSNEGQLRGMR